MEGGDNVAASPGTEAGKGDVGDAGGEAAERIGGEGGLDELAEAGVVGGLVEEESRWADETLLALGIGGLEQVSLRHQYEPGCVWVRQHHTWAPQYVRLEYLPIPIQTIERKNLQIIKEKKRKDIIQKKKRRV